MSFIKINKENIKTIFVLEDNQARIDFFTNIFGNIAYFVTKQVDVAIRELKRTKFDLIFLDHDLDDINEQEDERLREREKTGLDVANILRDTINCETPCIIHSVNPVGAGNMVKAHPFNTCHIPFHILKESLTMKEKKCHT